MSHKYQPNPLSIEGSVGQSASIQKQECKKTSQKLLKIKVYVRLVLLRMEELTTWQYSRIVRYETNISVSYLI